MTEKRFHFKQFSLLQHPNVLPITTEGIVLGAWAAKNSSAEQLTLDIGAGSGLLSLQLAQAGHHVHALELDPVAVEVCQKNVSDSPFAQQIRTIEADVIDFFQQKENHGAYHTIVSNPPFYENHLKSESAHNNTQKHTDSLPLHALAQAIATLLHAQGQAYVLLPPQSMAVFTKYMTNYGLYPQHTLRISHLENGKILRFITNFAKEKTEQQVTDLHIREANQSYSQPFIALTKDFYTIFE
jgi:tRNA1Val (adenine37-N6)-methyltransferase